MKTEKIVLSFIAVVIGLLVAGLGFYFYQSTKTQSQVKNPTVALNTPKPTISPKLILNITSPDNESVTPSSTTIISGTTSPDSTILINTQSTDSVTKPTSNGSFSSNISLDDGENQIIVTAVYPTGEEIQKIITVTSSSEKF